MTKRIDPRKTWTVWLVPAGLLLLSAVPLVMGALRLGQLAGGGPVTEASARFFASPLPVSLHILGASMYAVLGAFQFAPGLRQRFPRWHRRAGWLVVPSGLAAALTGLWMAHFYPWPAGDGPVLYAMRLLFGSWMTLALILAVRAIFARDFAAHGAWMGRAYAVGLGAGTQVLTALTWLVLVGTSDELARNIIMGSGWIVNLLVAEWVIRRRQPRALRSSALSLAGGPTPDVV